MNQLIRNLPADGFAPVTCPVCEGQPSARTGLLRCQVCMDRGVTTGRRLQGLGGRKLANLRAYRSTPRG